MAIFKSLKRIFSKSKPKPRLKDTRSTAQTSIADHVDDDLRSADHIDNDLICAARKGDIPNVQRLLTQSAAHDEYHDSRLINAYLAAASNNQADLVVMLIKEYQIYPDVTNAQGETALERAIRAGHGRTTRLLIENGADPFRGCQSPYDMAQRLWTRSALEMLNDKIEQVLPDQVEKLGRPKVSKKDGGKKTVKQEGEENENSDHQGYEKWLDQADKLPRLKLRNTDDNKKTVKQEEEEADEENRDRRGYTKWLDQVDKSGRSKVSNKDDGKKTVKKEEEENRDRHSHGEWPDRVFIRQGQREYMPPSDPAYWY
ncbi:hypothetical protein EIK77_001939 [Talaromyces pinophilus]|nr:hypothetical protein EIK77_001939 [Talaromyces pinophilus]PCG89262.1 Hypothetical protein PENO1_105680 [Penicillium occitanis (nom. inval.)]PCG89566.1 hypothetical protein PENOC_106030 [Penicillium occitanis (nom. inval.)]